MKRKTLNFPILERLAYIDRKIRAGYAPNCVKLERDLEVSVPTINRDIAFLRDRFNAPIEYD